MRDRKHLVSAEVDKLMEAAKGSRNVARDRCLLLLMFRHRLRVSEACGLRLAQVDTDSRVLHGARLNTAGPRRTRSGVTSSGRSKPGWESVRE
jgi:type 1 fimbriae regulatory protein FimB